MDLGFNSMGWTAEQQLDFVAHHLGPALDLNFYGDLKMIILDDQRPLGPNWADTVSFT